MAIFRTTGRHLIAQRIAGAEITLRDAIVSINCIAAVLDDLSVQTGPKSMAMVRGDAMIVGDALHRQLAKLDEVAKRLAPLRRECLKSAW
jgi:hypothetical protein